MKSGTQSVSRAKKTDLSSVIIIVVLSIWGLVILYPFYNAMLVSITPKPVYIRNPFMLYPKGFTFEAFRAILLSKDILIGYKTTLKILGAGLPLNMLLTSATGYCLAKSHFPGKTVIFTFIIITMFFNGGIIPLYLVVKSLGLMDSIFSVILCTSMNAFYLILTKNYFETIPISMEESAQLDGANDLVIFTKVYLPLAKPILATICLFYAVDRWNEWYLSMLFFRRNDLAPLQVVLRNIVNATTQMVTEVDTSRKLFSEGLKMAAVIVTMVPIMILYPFLQKYFMKGIMLGAVKG